MAVALGTPGCGGGGNKNSDSTTATADFTLTAAPSSLTVYQGSTASSTFTVGPLNGFTGSVALSANGLPTGVTAAFSSDSTTGTSTLTFTALSTATQGTATVTVIGVSGKLVHSTTLALTVAGAPEFTLAASPTSLTLLQGASGTSTVTITGVNAFADAVELTATGLPTGVTAAFSPASVSGTGTSTLTLTAGSAATLGNATVTLTGTSGSLTHTATLALSVLKPDFTLATSSSTLSVVQGENGAVAISVTALNGFSSSVALSTSGLPTGVTAAFASSSITGSTALTFTADSSATLGTATVTVSGTSGGLTRTVDIALTILAPAVERTWTLNGSTFTGTYVKTLGIFNNSVARHVEIAVTSGGNKGKNRSWPISSFSSDDRTYIAGRVAAEKPADKDPYLGTYLAKPHSYKYTKDTTGVNTLETDHFIFWWGTTAWSKSKAYSQYLEDIWTYDRFVLGLTMPYQIVPDNPDDLTDTNRYKINVFIDGTGLPGAVPSVGGAAAWGATEICVLLRYAEAGDSVIAHEFGHVLQNYAMGFRGWGFGPIGWAWENFAQFHQYQAMPDSPDQISGWWASPHWRPENVTNYFQYAAWAWAVGMDQDGSFPSSFAWDLWWHNLRKTSTTTAPDSLENLLQTVIRYGGVMGYLDSTDPNKAFGDVMGRFAAKSATMDFLGQDTLLSARGTTGFIPTEAVPDRSGWYRPTFGMAPYQFGTNVIQLVPDASATSITVNVNSLADSSDDQDMRATLVVVDSDGAATYSYADTNNVPMQGSGTLTLPVADGSTAYLAVASVPLTIYRPALQHHGFQAFRPLHYEFQATGATPAGLSSYSTSGTRLATHLTNADNSTAGFIASTATVDDTAYVGPDAVVLGTAKILGHARIEGHALVKGSATVTDYAVVSDYAQVTGGTISGHARVRDEAVVRTATVTDSAALYGKASIWNAGTIGGKAIVKDDAGVDLSYGGTSGTINGSTLIAQCADFGLPKAATIAQGRFYENCKTDYLDDSGASGVGGNIFTYEAKTAENGNYLFANWDFAYASPTLAMDAWGNCDAILRGTTVPVIGTDSATSKTIVTLDGTDQYLALDPRTADSTDTTVDVMVKIDDTSVMDQHLFDFGASASDCFYLTPNENGAMKLVLMVGGVATTVTGTVPTSGTWINLRAEIDGAAIRLYQDGTLVGSTATTVYPMDLHATRNFLGRNQAGTVFLKGSLDYVRVYRNVVADGAFSIASGGTPGVPPAALRYYDIAP